MVIATHEMGFARDIADRVCFLDDGGSSRRGRPSDLPSAPREERTRQFLAAHHRGRAALAGPLWAPAAVGSGCAGPVRGGVDEEPPQTVERRRASTRFARDGTAPR